MANYVLPVFNVNVAFWRWGNPTTNPPDVLAIGNLSPGRIVSGDKGDDNFGATLGQTMWLRLPKGTDVQDAKNNFGWDTCECPYTSGRFYNVIIVDDIGGGFPNEHRFAVIAGVATWPTPFPPVGGFTPIVPPVPPTFWSAFSSLPGGGGPMTLTPPSTGGSIGGCFALINPGGIPTVRVNGRPNCCFNAGGGYSVTYSPLGMPTIALYPFLDIGIVGVNSVVVDPGGIPPQLFIGYLFTGMGTGTALTAEWATSGPFGPPSGPAYPPNPAHPKIHMVYALDQNPIGAQGWALPFMVAGASSPAMAAGVLHQLYAGIYLASAGGVFPAHGTGACSAWCAIQNSYVP